MNTEVIITGIIGLITSITSGWTTWFFTRKKYSSEVDHNLIENMETSLEFYKKLSDDNRARLEEMASRNKNLELELQELRRQVLNLTMNICMDLTCRTRKRESMKLQINKNEKKDRFDETNDSSRGGIKPTESK